MITQEQLENMQPGVKISYGSYGQVFFSKIVTHRADGSAYDNTHVEMTDCNGDTKLVFESLFKRHARVI